MAKTAREKLNADKKPKKVDLDYAFGGLKPGQRMFVGTPQIIKAWIDRIPYGETHTVEAMRNAIARKYGCNGMCPVSTSIFIRTVAEVALDDLANGKQVSDVSPFWRLIDGQHKISKRLPVDLAWIAEQRRLEASKAG